MSTTTAEAAPVAAEQVSGASQLARSENLNINNQNC
jgi:hypothetical protein